MLECVHHWKQQPEDLRAPFVCLRCGSVREFETSYFALLDGKESGYSFGRRNRVEVRSRPAAAIAHGNSSHIDEESELTPNPRVLVVDDEAVTALMIKRLLEGRLAYEVETALNGRQALEKAERFHPDLALLDIRMPDMDGFEVCRRMKDNPSTANSSIVYFSAYPRPEGAVDHAEAYLRKPLEETVLLHTVEFLVGKGA